MNRKKQGTNGPAKRGMANISISSAEYHDRGVMCCATIAGEQECSQLYDYGNYISQQIHEIHPTRGLSIISSLIRRK